MLEHEILVVRWVDASSSSRIFSPEEFREYECVVMETIGWGYELEDRVVLAGDYYPSIPEKGQVAQYRVVSNIPKACIKSIKRARIEEVTDELAT